MKTSKSPGQRAAEVMGGGDVSLEEFVGLTAGQMWLIDLKIDLGEAIREHRMARGWTQAQLARALKISQPRVANMEAGGPSVTVDVQLLALRALGLTRETLGETLSGERATEEGRELVAA